MRRQGGTHGSSLRICASSYVKAFFEAITDFVKRTLMISASEFISCRNREIGCQNITFTIVLPACSPISRRTPAVPQMASENKG